MSIFISTTIGSPLQPLDLEYVRAKTGEQVVGPLLKNLQAIELQNRSELEVLETTLTLLQTTRTKTIQELLQRNSAISVQDVLGVYEENRMKGLQKYKQMEVIEICRQATAHVNAQESQAKACFQEHLQVICN
jgi:hypothetical protein